MSEPRLAAGGNVPRACLVVAKLQIAKQVELQLQRQRGDFIEEESAARGLGQLVGPIERVIRCW